MLPFIRSDLAQLKAYVPHPSTAGNESDHATEATQFDQLDTNESPYDLPEDLKQKLSWTYQQAIRTNRYPDGGHEELKRAIAEYVNESASNTYPNVTSANISVGNGSDELIRSLLIATCLQGEGSILVAEPTFSMYAILARTLGISVKAIGRSPANFEMDLAAAQAALVEPHNPPIRGLFVVHPNSPTANALTQAELEWLRGLPEKLLVVIDEAYFEFSQTTVVAELQQRPNWVILRTFSKAFRLAAHRIGYAIAHPDLTVALEKVRLPYNLPSFSQLAAQVALAHRQILFESIPEILHEREQLIQVFANLGLQVWPSAANFIYLRPVLSNLNIDYNTLLTRIAKELKLQGTLVRQISDGLRITVGSPAENERTCDRLHQALQTISQNCDEQP